MDAPAIYHLKIEHFRGIENLSWHPSQGVNVILGGGDVGKTTILEAIGLLLSPSNPSTLLDTDYRARNIDAGFAIEAVLRLPNESGINDQTKPSWPWIWNGTEVLVPGIDEDESQGEPVYRLRVRGTSDLELMYEIVQPDGNTDHLSVGLRRSIGLVRLAGDDRHDRDLRLVHGSALDRLLSDKNLRSRLVSGLAENEVANNLTEEAKERLEALDQAFKNRRLPGDLDLAITGAHGLSISALIGLTAECEGVQLPLASWGAGTRRFAALAIAEENQGEAPITLVDEVERGLEPYRQRVLISTLQNGKSQTFVTTHSPSVLAAASESAVWYVDQAGSIGSLDAVKIDRHRRTDPEAFFARLTVIAEGVTERGFVIALLEKALGSSLSQHGVYVADAGGNESALNLLEALERGGLTFAGFADEEGKFPSRWREVQAHLGDLLFRWRAGCLEENIIGAVPNEKLESLLIDPDEDKTGRRLRTLADRLSMDQKEFEGLKAAAGSRLRDVILEAALGKVPADDTIDKKAYSKHGQTWFKSVKGGRELAQKLFDLDAWSTLRPELMTFCNAVRRALDLAQLEDLIHE